MGSPGDARDSASASGIDSFSDSSQAGEEPENDVSGRSVTKCVSVQVFSTSTRCVPDLARFSNGL